MNSSPSSTTSPGGGPNKGYRLSHALKPVRPPVVPGSTPGPSPRPREPQSPRGPMLPIRTVVSLESPGQDSVDRESTTSCMTTESTSSGNGYRNSFASTDSRGSGSVQRLPQFRSQVHSSSSSIVSCGERGEDMICPVDVASMMESGMPDTEILNSWLSDMGFEDYCHLFVVAGYDMYTISRMTPEDLTAIGIQKPNHRKRLKSEISKLNIGDGLPDFIPDNLEYWLHLIRLSDYGPYFRYQGYNTIDAVSKITIEDLEDFGILKLGHQKRFLLAVKKIKDIKSGKIKPKMNTLQPINLQPLQVSQLPSNNLNNNRRDNDDGAGGMHNNMTQHYQPEVIQIVRPVSRASPSRPSFMNPNYNAQPQPPVSASDHHSHIYGQFQPMPPEPRGRLRSFDDSHYLLHPGGQSHMKIPDPLRTSGGTLPRPRGLVKPMPVAKIPANFRHEGNGPPSPDDLGKGSFQPKGMTFSNPTSPKKTSTFGPISSSSSASPVRNPETNMMSNNRIGPSRSTGDVLNDIGSMLADLTDELDAMLHSDRSTNNPSDPNKQLFQA